MQTPTNLHKPSKEFSLAIVVAIASVALMWFLMSNTRASATLQYLASGNAGNDYKSIARQDATNAGIDPDLFERQIQLESAFNPNAVGPNGKVGIAQLQPTMVQALGVDPHDPNASLQAAAQLMAKYYTKYKTYMAALAAYHTNTATVQAAANRCSDAWLSCMSQDVQNYVRAIDPSGA
jgi:soluble lytic murein transglycosylase-like protein